MLTFSEFKNILQLIASDDLECKILGQELAKQYNFCQRQTNSYYDLIFLDEHYIVFKEYLVSLFGSNVKVSYEQAYENYL